MWVGCSICDAATSSPAGESTADEKSWPSMIMWEYAVRMITVRISRTIDVSRVWINSTVMGSSPRDSTPVAPLGGRAGIVLVHASRTTARPAAAADFSPATSRQARRKTSASAL